MPASGYPYLPSTGTIAYYTPTPPLEDRKPLIATSQKRSSSKSQPVTIDLSLTPSTSSQSLAKSDSKADKPKGKWWKKTL